jgi:hypothetical protein
VKSVDIHTYTQRWFLPYPPAKDGYTSFTLNQIQLDENGGFLKTQNPQTPNISIYNFSSAPLSITKTPVALPASSYNITDFCQIDLNWQGGGSSQVVSLIYPRKTQASEIAPQIVETGNPLVNGFTLEMENVNSITYLSAADKNQILISGEIEITGESLLTVKNGDIIKGTALGCAEFKINGIKRNINAENFEFIIENGIFRVEGNINAPVNPVKISPDVDKFVDKLQIELYNETKNAVIYYTTDGSEPNLSKSLYTAPFTITDSTVVKARAYRTDAGAEPAVYSGTDASPVSAAYFYKSELRKADY